MARGVIRIDERGIFEGANLVRPRRHSSPQIQPPAPATTGTSGVTPPMVSGGIIGVLGGALGTAIGGPIGGTIGGAIGGLFEGGDPTPPMVPTFGSQKVCPPPTIFDPGSGVCLTPGSPGEVSVPDVTDVTSPDIGMGVFGLLSMQPIVVGEIQGRPILRCPVPGLVLGKDNRCYSKKDLPKQLRKWRPHKCSSRTDKQLQAVKKAGAAAKSLKGAFKGTGLTLSSSSSSRRKR